MAEDRSTRSLFDQTTDFASFVMSVMTQNRVTVVPLNTSLSLVAISGVSLVQLKVYPMQVIMKIRNMNYKDTTCLISINKTFFFFFFFFFFFINLMPRAHRARDSARVVANPIQPICYEFLCLLIRLGKLAVF